MPIQFRCKECRKRLSISRRKVGQPIECPACKAELKVPAVSDLGKQLNELLLASAGADRSTTAAEHGSNSTPTKQNHVVQHADDEPLFERQEFREMLLAKSSTDHELPVVEPSVAKAAVARPATISLTTSTLFTLGASVALLLFMAFAAGYLLGSR
jgi:hypothetical protein